MSANQRNLEVALIVIVTLFPFAVNPAPTHNVDGTIGIAAAKQLHDVDDTAGAAWWDGAGKRYTYSATSTIESTRSASIYLDATFAVSPIDSIHEDGINMIAYALEVETISFRQQSQDDDSETRTIETNFSRWFSFTVDSYGEVAHCHYPSDEDVHVVGTKKEFVSVISATLKKPPHGSVSWGGVHKYTSDTDNDRDVGRHRAEYSVTQESMSGDLHYTRSKVLQEHPQLDLNHTENIAVQAGTIRSVDITQSAVLAGKRAMESPEATGTVGGGAEFGGLPLQASGIESRINSNVDIGFSARSRTHVRLIGDRVGTRLALPSNSGMHVGSSMVTGDVLHVPPPAGKRGTADARAEAERLMECAVRERASHAVDPGRVAGGQGTKCFKDLVQQLQGFEEQEITHFGIEHLTSGADALPEVADVTVDLLGTVGSATAQDILLEIVLNGTNDNADTTPELIKRVFVHCVDLARPATGLVAMVEAIAFGDTGRPILDTDDMVIHARLALGALVAILRKVDTELEDVDRTAKLVSRLSAEVKVHASRQRRRAYGDDRTEEMALQETHMVSLLEALGNTGDHSTLKHILPFARDSRTPLSVRAASVHSLRSFQSKDIENLIVDMMIYDPHVHVRKTAEQAFLAQRRSKTFVEAATEKRSHDVWLHANNMSSAGRRRRLNIPTIPESWIETMDAWELEVKLPPFEWGLEVGAELLKGSAGFSMVNAATFEQDRLTSFFDVEIRDEAFASLSIFGVNWDLFRAKVCFAGHIEFDLNIVKNGLGKMQKQADAFTKLYDIVSIDLVDGFEKLWAYIEELLFDGNPVDDVVTAVKQLPKMFTMIAGANAEDVEAVFVRIYAVIERTSEIASVSAAKNIIDSVLTLYKSAKSQVMDFYMKISNMITVDFPWAWETITGSAQLLSDGVNLLYDAPGQAFQLIIKAAAGLGSVYVKVMDMVAYAKKIFDWEQRPVEKNTQ